MSVANMYVYLYPDTAALIYCIVNTNTDDNDFAFVENHPLLSRSKQQSSQNYEKGF